MKSLTRLVRPLPRGQITLPIDFRRRLKIDEQTILRLSLKGAKIEILPLHPLAQKEGMREYKTDEIQRFLEEDRLDPRAARKVWHLLRRRA